MRHHFDSSEFQKTYHTDAPLGAFCGSKGTLFRLWAPTAQKVELRLYPAGNATPAETILPLLSREGYGDLAMELLLQDTYPSCGYWLSRPAFWKSVSRMAGFW